MSYESWKHEIYCELRKIGFSEKEAKRKAANYAGLFGSEANCTPVEKIITRIMNKGLEIWMLDESNLFRWHKAHNIGIKERPLIYRHSVR